MFKKLGYELCEPRYKDEIIYTKKVYILGWSYFDIFFWRDGKSITCEQDITMEELKAINKQVEELGWK